MQVAQGRGLRAMPGLLLVSGLGGGFVLRLVGLRFGTQPGPFIELKRSRSSWIFLKPSHPKNTSK